MIRRPPRSTQSRSSAASDVYKRQGVESTISEVSRVEIAQSVVIKVLHSEECGNAPHALKMAESAVEDLDLSLIHISEPTRRTPISYAVFCLKKKKQTEHITRPLCDARRD